MLSTQKNLEKKEESPFALCSDLPEYDNVFYTDKHLAQDGRFYTVTRNHIRIYDGETLQRIQKIDLPHYFHPDLTNERLAWHRIWVMPGQGAILSSHFSHKTLILDTNFKIKKELDNFAFETRVIARLDETQFICQIKSETPQKTGLYLCQFVDGEFNYKILTNRTYGSIALLPDGNFVTARTSYDYILNNGKIIETEKVTYAANTLTFTDERGNTETHFHWSKKFFTRLEKWSKDHEGNFKCIMSRHLKIEQSTLSPTLTTVGDHSVALCASVADRPQHILQIWDCQHMICKKDFGEFKPLCLSLTVQKILVIPEMHTAHLLMIDLETLKLTRQKIDECHEIHSLIRLPNNDIILRADRKMLKCQIITKKILSDTIDMASGALYKELADTAISFLYPNVSDNPMAVFASRSTQESKSDKSKKITRRASI